MYAKCYIDLGKQLTSLKERKTEIDSTSRTRTNTAWIVIPCEYIKNLLYYAVKMPPGAFRRYY